MIAVGVDQLNHPAFVFFEHSHFQLALNRFDAHDGRIQAIHDVLGQRAVQIFSARVVGIAQIRAHCGDLAFAEGEDAGQRIPFFALRRRNAGADIGILSRDNAVISRNSERFAVHREEVGPLDQFAGLERRTSLFEDAAGLLADKDKASAILRRSKLDKTESVSLYTLAFGDVGFTFTGGEFFDVLFRRLRDASPYKLTMTVGYTNGSLSYMPDAFGFANGGYEPLQCNCIPGTSETFCLELVRQLNELKNTPDL